MKRIWTYILLGTGLTLHAFAQDSTAPIPPSPLTVDRTTEIERVGRQVEELQKQLEAMRTKGDNVPVAEIAEVREELARVQAEIANLKSRTAAAPAPPAVPVPSANPLPPAVPLPPIPPLPSGEFRRVENGRFSLGKSLDIGADEVVDGDVAVVGGSLTVDGRVNGKVSVTGGSATVNGLVTGDLNVKGGSTEVNGRVGGKVETVGGSIDLGPEAIVDGNVYCRGGSVNRSDSARIGGAIDVVNGSTENHSSGHRRSVESTLFNDEPGANIPTFLFLFAVGAICLVAWPKRLDTVGRAFIARPGHSFLIGLASLPGMIAVIVLLALTIIGIPFIPIVPLALFAAFVMGVVAVAVMLGRRLLVGRPYKSRLFPLFIGLLVWFAGSFFGMRVGGVLEPIIVLATFFVLTAALGAALTTGFGRSPYWLKDRATRRGPIPKIDPTQTYAGTGDFFGDTV